MKMKTALWFVSATLTAIAALAYEPHVVHHRMTEVAFESARLQHDFLKRFLLEPHDLLNGRTAQRWTADGAEDEDQFTRPLSHFYDPVNAIPLSIGPCPKSPVLSAVRADLWGVSTSSNGYGIAAAKQRYRMAMQGTTAAQRRTALAQMFYGLGHVMHLIEDMAQPEHTRNDQHLYPTSLYEKYTHELFVNPASVGWPGFDDLSFLAGYTPPVLPGYASFFHTATREGIADYSNANFVTQDTNFHDTVRDCPPFDYASPTLSLATETTVTKTENVIVGSWPFYSTIVKTFDVTTIRHDVPDVYTGATDTNRILTHRSFLDYELCGSDALPPCRFNDALQVYSVNLEGRRDQASLLMRRGVGYAAGLLQHFFRGRVAVKWIRTDSPQVFEARFTNDSPEALTNATAQLYVRIQQPGVDVSVPAALIALPPIQPGQTVSLPVIIDGYTFQPGETLESMERRVLITGALGIEADAVIGLVQPASRGTIFVYHGTPPNPEFARVHLGGTGAIETVRTLGPGDDPFSVFGADRNGRTSLSPNAELVAFLPEGALNTNLVGLAETEGSSSWIISPQAQDGQLINFRSAYGWSRDSQQIVGYATKKCEPRPCGRDGLGGEYGIALVDVHTGSGTFRAFPQITKTFLETHNLLNNPRLSPDETVLYIAEPCCASSRLIRFDLLSAQIEVGPPGRTFYDYEVAFDGRLIGSSFHYDTPTLVHAIFEVIWPSTWTKLTDISHVHYGSIALSPDQSEIAYVKLTCAGYQIWTLERTTGVARPGADACGASSQYFFSWLRWPE